MNRNLAVIRQLTIVPAGLSKATPLGMVTHMKTTIDIADALFERAKLVAERDRITFRALVEEGLQVVLERRANSGANFRLRDASVGGSGVQPGVDLANRDQMLSLMYEGRGA